MLFWDEAVELWDGPAGRRIREFPKLPLYYHHSNGEFGGIDLSADGRRLALLPRDPTGQAAGRIFDLDTGKTLCTLTPQPLPRSGGVARFSADGKRLVRIAYSVARIWDAESGEDACPLPGHRGAVHSLAVLTDGKTVVSSGADLTVRAWNPTSGEEIWQTAVPQTVMVKFAAADAVVVQEDAFGRDGAALCLDPRTGASRSFPGALAKAKEDSVLAIAPDGKRVVSLDYKQRAFRVWSWPAGELLSTVPLAPPEPFQLSRCAQAQFTSDGKQFLAVMDYSHPAEQQVMRSVPDHAFVERWDLAAGKLLERLESGNRDRPFLMPHAAGLYLFTNGSVRDAVTGRLVVKLRYADGEPPGRWLAGAAVSPDGRWLAVGESHPGRALWFEMRTGRLRATTMQSGRQFVGGVHFLPDSRLISLGPTAIVWPVGLKPAAARERLEDAELAQFWERLADPNPEKAWPAMVRLAGAMRVAEFAHGRLRAVPKIPEGTLDRILQELDSKQFKVREAASKELDGLGSAVVAAVRERMNDLPVEAKERARKFLERHDKAELTPEHLRALRAVEVLEAEGSPEAREILGQLAGGEPTARLTQEASAAMRRLRRD
jgi:WD40 repeat protein